MPILESFAPPRPCRVAAAPAAIRARAPRTWLSTQVGWPLAAFAFLTLILIPLGGDRWIADRLYAWEGGTWALRHAFLTEAIIHEAGHDLSLLAWLGVAAATLAAFIRSDLRRWRWPLLHLAASVLLATAVVGVLKHLTRMDCPWDLAPYGGLRPYIPLFAHRPADLQASSCFPAGHASAGYAWVALYFFFLATRPGWRWAGLATGLGIGLVFGISQQLRGAHFLSHDVWTLAICWFTALLLYRAIAYGRIAAAAGHLIRAGRPRPDPPPPR